MTQRLFPIPTFLDESNQSVVLKHFHPFPNRLRNRQREKLCNVPSQTFIFDDQLVAHRVIGCGTERRPFAIRPADALAV